MGSLSSRPKAPAQTQAVYVPVSASAGSPPPVSSATPPATQTPEQAASAARTGSLLQRGRGIFGTVQTSFRGLLELAGTDNKRKTLLGE